MHICSHDISSKVWLVPGVAKEWCKEKVIHLESCIYAGNKANDPEAHDGHGDDTDPKRSRIVYKHRRTNIYYVVTKLFKHCDAIYWSIGTSGLVVSTLWCSSYTSWYGSYQGE